MTLQKIIMRPSLMVCRAGAHHSEIFTFTDFFKLTPAPSIHFPPTHPTTSNPIPFQPHLIERQIPPKHIPVLDPILHNKAVPRGIKPNVILHQIIPCPMHHVTPLVALVNRTLFYVRAGCVLTEMEVEGVSTKQALLPHVDQFYSLYGLGETGHVHDEMAAWKRRKLEKKGGEN